MKITGGSLKVKALLSGRDGEETWEEKADQLRVYSGSGFRLVQSAEAGMVCAVTGLSHTRAGEGLGAETNGEQELLEPVLTYRIAFPEDCDAHRMLGDLKTLEEEIPELHIVWEEELGEIHAQLMGEVQIENPMHSGWKPVVMCMLVMPIIPQGRIMRKCLNGRMAILTMRTVEACLLPWMAPKCV